jgi:aminoglycoside 6'-N-acetyltransferase I
MSDNGDFVIREAALPDLEELAELRLSLQSHCERSNSSVWRITDEGERLITQKLEHVLKDDKSRVFVAEADGNIVGFASGQASSREDYSPSKVASIENVFVREAYRKRGIGKRLVKELCRFFDSMKAEQVTLRYILGNREAECFWTQLGFKPIITTAGTTPKELKTHLNPNRQKTIKT